MESLNILRIPSEDGNGGFVLVQVTSSGSKALDVKLVATEGQAPYTAKLRHKNIDQLRAANSPSSSDEWEGILAAVVLGTEQATDVESVAKIHDGVSIDIIIRRRVEGINQKLGTLTLKAAEDAIEILDWCSDAVLGRERAKDDLAAALAKAAELDAAVAGLKDQLAELIEAKRTDETEMLEKFRDLLNEKKVKIREQQQILLAGPPPGLVASLGHPAATPATEATVKEEPESSPARPKRARRGAAAAAKPAASKGRPKRKAAQAAVSEDDDDEEDGDDGSGKMDVDSKPGDHGNMSEEDRHTTDDSETGSDSDDEPAASTSRAGPSRATASAAEKGPPSAGAQGAKPKNMPVERVLPFGLGKQPARPTASAAQQAAAGSETDSDDEL